MLMHYHGIMASPFPARGLDPLQEHSSPSLTRQNTNFNQVEPYQEATFSPDATAGDMSGEVYEDVDWQATSTEDKIKIIKAHLLPQLAKFFSKSEEEAKVIVTRGAPHLSEEAYGNLFSTDEWTQMQAFSELSRVAVASFGRN